LLVGLFALNASAAIMRSYYLRGLERELELYGAEIRMPGMGLEKAPIRSPSLIRFLLPMLSHRRGVFPNALVQSLLYVVMGALAIGVSVAAIWRIHDVQLQVWTSIFYGLCAAAFATIAIRTGLGARRFRRTLIDKLELEHARRDEDDLKGGARSLGSYLFLPRPLDLMKVAFIAAGALLSYFLASAGHRTSIWLLIVFVLAFELLVYQARYMRNDFRDRFSDPGHPLASAKRRPPSLVGHRDRLVWFEGAFIARLLLAALFVLWLLLTHHGRIALIFAAGSVLVWLIADVYEAVKERAKVLRSEPPFRRGGWQTALFLWVGVGYGVRTLVGLTAGSQTFGWNWHSATAMALVLVWGVFFGAMFVTMTWAFEASAFAAQEDEVYDARLRARGHTAALGGEAGLFPAGSKAVVNAVHEPEHPGRERSHVLRPRREAPMRIWTTWNLAYVLALVASTFVGVEVASDWSPAAIAYAGAAAAAAIAAASAAALVAVRAPAACHSILGLVAAVAIPAIGLAAQLQDSYLAGLATAAVALLYGFFLSLTYYELTHPEETWGAVALASGAFLERRLLGEGEFEMRWRALQRYTGKAPPVDD
jgi:MFS family permease